MYQDQIGRMSISELYWQFHLPLFVLQDSFQVMQLFSLVHQQLLQSTPVQMWKTHQMAILLLQLPGILMPEEIVLHRLSIPVRQHLHVEQVFAPVQRPGQLQIVPP